MDEFRNPPSEVAAVENGGRSGDRRTTPWPSSCGWGRRANPVFGDEYAAVRDVLKSVRLAAGLSHRGLAQRIGKHPSHVSKIECGQRRVDVLDLYLLAKAVRMEPDRLFGLIATRIEALASEPPSR